MKPCFSERGYRLLNCRVCELFYIDPYPEDVGRHHDVVSHYAYSDLKIQETEKHYDFEIIFYKDFFAAIEQECQGAKSVLDVGCGCGHLLERLGAVPNLYRAGVELNSARAEFARRVAGCEIFTVPIEGFFSTTRFDVITLINVLSHFPSLDQLFLRMKSLLKPDGKLILKVGEMRGDARKSAVFDWQIPDHLHFLGLNTVDYLCNKYGFQIERRERVPFSKLLFSTSTWKARGRSRVRNAIKSVVVRTPFALPLLARSYELIHRQSVFSSFIVLRALP